MLVFENLQVLLERRRNGNQGGEEDEEGPPGPAPQALRELPPGLPEVPAALIAEAARRILRAALVLASPPRNEPYLAVRISDTSNSAHGIKLFELN